MTIPEWPGNFLLHNKIEVYLKFKQFIIDLSNQFPFKIHTIRNDSGTEFLSYAFQELLHYHGILHQLSCPYIPQQNGRVEKKQQHILQVVRCLKIQASIPNIYWGECVLTTV